MSAHNGEIQAERTANRRELLAARQRIADLEAQLVRVPTEGVADRYSFDSLLEGCQIISFDWHYLYLNDKAAQFGRQPKRELLGRTITDCYPGIEATEVFAALQRCMSERTSENAELPFTYADGNTAWFEFRIQPIPEGILVLTVDITNRKQAEALFHISDQHLRFFVERAPAAIAMFDRDMKYLLVSQRWMSDYRLGDQNVIGRSHYEIFPDIPAEWKATHRRCLNGAVERSDGDPFLRADGSIDWVRWEIQPWRDMNGDIGGIFLFTEVITERKQAEGALRESEAKYRLLTENMADVVWTVDISNMRFTYVSPSVEQLRGYTPEEVRSQSFDEVLTPASLDAIHQRRGRRLQAFLSGDPAALTQTEEFEQIRKDGSSVWTESVTTLVKDESGGVQIVGVSRDITNRKQAEEQLNKLNRTLTILSDINQAIIRVRPIPALFETACRIAVDKGGFRMAWVGMLDEETQHAYPVAHAVAGDDSQPKLDVLGVLPPGQDLAAISLHITEPVVINDIEQDPGMEALRGDAERLGYRAMAIFPLKVFGRVRATLSLYADEPHFFDDEEFRLLNEMAGDIAFAMEFDEQELQREQAEATLRASEEKYRSLVESTDSVIAVFDGDGVILYVNQIGAQALHLTPETSVGKRMSDLFPPEVAQYQMEFIREAIRTGQGAVYEETSVVLGEQRWYRTSIQPIFDAAGKATSVLVNAVDISRHKQTEAELQCARDTLEQRVEERTEQLRTAKEQVEAILENSIDGILLVGADFRIVRTNNAVNILLGCEQSSCVNQSLFDLIHAEDRERGQSAIQRIITEPVGRQIELRIVRLDGSTFDAEIGVGQLTNNEFVCTIRDITERKAQVRQLRYYASLQESVSDAVIATDREFRIQSWNRAAEAIYGWRSEEVIGKTVTDVLLTEFESEQEKKRIVKEFFDRGYWSGEFTQRHKDGGEVHIFGATTLFRDEQGGSLGVVTVNRDDTERKRAEDALRESEARYRALFEQSHDAVFILDLEGNHLQANVRAAELLGYTADEIQHLSVSDISAQAAQSQRILERLNIGEHIPVYERLFKRKNGDVIPVEVNVELVRDSMGRPLHIQSVVRDIHERKEAELTLHKYTADIHDLYNNAPCGYHSLDKNGIVVQINDTELRWLGYERDEVIGKLKIADMYTPESKRLFRETFTHFVERGWINDLEFDIVRRDGSSLHVLLNATAIYDEDGQFLKSRSTMFDITELQRARLALMESEARYRLLAENVTDVIVKNSPDGIRTFVTPSCYTLIGYRPEELLGQYGLEIVHPDDRPQSQAVIMRASISSESSYTLTQRIRHKAGHYIWVEVSGTIVRDPETGLPTETVAVIRDITERKRAEETLRESEERFRQIADNIDQVLFVRSGDEKTVLYVNPTYESMWGRSRESFYEDPESFMQRVHPDDLDDVRLHMKNAQYLDDGHAYFEFRIIAAAEETHWVRLRMFPIRGDDGSIARRVGIIEDITRQKHYEESLERALKQEQELGELKSRFVSMASHEFRTPLASILSSTELLLKFRQKMDDEKVERKLMLITEHVAHLTSVIEDVLQLTRIQTHRIQFSPVLLDPNTLCHEIVEEFRDHPEFTHRLQYAGPKKSREMLLDKRLMRQIISNLVSNALKYSSEHTVVKVGIAFEDNMLIVTVRDEGIGIPESDLKRLFEPFHRAGNVGAVPGTGLGLSITKESAELHGGAIAVESFEGVGTQFTVTIPDKQNQ